MTVPVKVWNLAVKRGVDGSKHLDIQMHGVIDGGWYDDDGVDTAKTIAEMNQHLDAKTVAVRINSIGGSAFGGVAMYNALQAHPGDVTCCVEGLAASAASLVAMAGKTVMGKGAMMMIHPPLTMAVGNADELRKTADVLDKVQDSLASIYSAKTGKSVDEINDMLDAETWMTADEAVEAGFADEVMPDVKTDYGPGEQVPSEQKDETGAGASGIDDDEEDGDGDDDDDFEDRAPRMTDGGVRWLGVTFPAAEMPQRILAMAKQPKPPAPAPVQTPAAPPPVLAVVPPPVAVAPLALTRADLEARAPQLLAALLEEGRAAGVAAERARLQAIDDLGVKGCADLVHAAKYGNESKKIAPSDAPTLAVAIVKAGQVAGADLLALRRAESTAIAAVVATAPDQTAGAEEARHIQAMVRGGNARRGGGTHQ